MHFQGFQIMLSRSYFFLFFITNPLAILGLLHCQESNCSPEKPTEENKKEKSNAEAEKKNEDKKVEKDNGKDEKKEEIRPPRIGNFSLPTSQQPAALFGFGGNIIDKNEIQFYVFVDDLKGKRRITTDVIPGLLFGITDDWSIFFNTPVSPVMRDGKYRSSGLEDFFIQLEYAFYNKKTYTYEDQATVVANITFPTGSVKKMPPTGFGAPSFFLGATYYRTTVDWVLFTSHGAVLTTSDHKTKFGDEFLYQFGIARNIPSPRGWIYALMLELDGQYFRKNQIDGKIDPNSGGNTIFVTPSFWVSNKYILIQSGVSFIINQNLFGKQNKFDYVFNLNVAWSFY